MTPTESASYRLWLNQEGTVLVRVWKLGGRTEVCLRDDQGQVWGPPIEVVEVTLR